MTDLKDLKNQISPQKQTDKQFFLSLLDAEAEFAYEQKRLLSVMLMLKALYINKLRAALSEARDKRHKLNSSPEHSAADYSAVLELNKTISKLVAKINSYKPFFEEPYFARMDVVDDKEGYNSYYIGKRGDEGLEIVDWRAPLARRYYQKSKTSFKINDYEYKLILRRALRTANGKLLDMKNEYLNLSDYLSREEIGGRDQALVFDPFLKEILSSRKEKKEICDIIQTIQEKQYEIITLPERDQFVLQGVAGSGKTMIMLHRLSYILYNNEGLKPSDVLVLTPSDSFNAFIEELSAVLELEKVKTCTIFDYFLKILKGVGLDIGGRVDRFFPVPEEYFRYIYSPEFSDDVDKKLSKIFDGVHGMFTSADCAEAVAGVERAFKAQRENYDYIKNTSVRVRRCVLGEIKEKKEGGIFYTKQFRNLFNCVQDAAEFLALSSHDKRMEGQAYFYRQLLSFYKSMAFIRRYSEKICLSAIEDLKSLDITIGKEIDELSRYKVKVGGAETLTYADRIERRREVKKKIAAVSARVEEIRQGFYPAHDLFDVLRTDSALTSIGKCENTADVARFFYREIVKKAKRRFGVESKSLLTSDPFSICLILSRLGYDLSPKHGFVFVDEAQDISLAEYSVLRAVNADAAFNIFGDLKQNVTDYRGVGDWGSLGYKTYNLTLNYRNTNEIVDFVSEKVGIAMQSIGLDGDKVDYIEKRRISGYLSDKNGLRAVICSESEIAEFTRKAYNVVRRTGKISKKAINLLTVYESKGLEFTAVCVSDKAMSDNEKYVAYTRALKNLAIIK